MLTFLQPESGEKIFLLLSLGLFERGPFPFFFLRRLQIPARAALSPAFSYYQRDALAAPPPTKSLTADLSTQEVDEFYRPYDSAELLI